MVRRMWERNVRNQVFWWAQKSCYDWVHFYSDILKKVSRQHVCVCVCVYVCVCFCDVMCVCVCVCRCDSWQREREREFGVMGVVCLSTHLTSVNAKEEWWLYPPPLTDPPNMCVRYIERYIERKWKRERDRERDRETQRERERERNRKK